MPDAVLVPPGLNSPMAWASPPPLSDPTIPAVVYGDNAPVFLPPGLQSPMAFLLPPPAPPADPSVPAIVYADPPPPLFPPGLISPAGVLGAVPPPVSDSFTPVPLFNDGPPPLALTPPGLLSPMAWQQQPVVAAADPSTSAPVTQPLTGLFV